MVDVQEVIRLMMAGESGQALTLLESGPCEDALEGATLRGRLLVEKRAFEEADAVLVAAVADPGGATEEDVAVRAATAQVTRATLLANYRPGSAERLVALEAALSVLQSYKNHALFTSGLVVSCQLHRRQNDFRAALDRAMRLSSTADALKDGGAALQARLQAGLALEGLHMRKEAEEALVSAVRLAEAMRASKPIQVECFAALARVQVLRGEREAAQATVDRGFAVYGGDRSESLNLVCSALMAGAGGLDPEATFARLHALVVDDPTLAVAYCELAALRSRGQAGELDALSTAQARLREAGREDLARLLDGSVARALNGRGDTVGAVALLSRGELHPWVKACFSVHLTPMLAATGQEQAAIEGALEALPALEAFGQLGEVVMLQAHLARIYLQGGLYEQATDHVSRAGAAAEAVNNRRLVGFVALVRAELAAKQGRIESVRAAGRRASAAEDTGSVRRIALLEANLLIEKRDYSGAQRVLAANPPAGPSLEGPGLMHAMLMLVVRVMSGERSAELLTLLTATLAAARQGGQEAEAATLGQLVSLYSEGR